MVADAVLGTDERSEATSCRASVAPVSAVASANTMPRLMTPEARLASAETHHQLVSARG